MKLSSDWFVEGMLDFEYKKYVLLAYLQHVSREFAEMRLYPSFSDLIFHYKNLHFYQENKRKLLEKFPKRISEEEFKKLTRVFSDELDDDSQLKEIEQIVAYSLPIIQEHLSEGKEIYEFIDHQLLIEPIGITPLYKNEGYVLLQISQSKIVKAFEYRIVFFENVEANYHGISMKQVDSFRKSLVNTYEFMKLQLIRNHAKFPNPATYLLLARNELPEDSALLPVAKRKFLLNLKPDS